MCYCSQLLNLKSALRLLLVAIIIFSSSSFLSIRCRFLDRLGTRTQFHLVRPPAKASTRSGFFKRIQPSAIRLSPLKLESTNESTRDPPVPSKPHLQNDDKVSSSPPTSSSTQPALAAPASPADLILSFPAGIMPQALMLQYIRKWATEMASTGESLKAVKIDNGVSFLFLPSPGSRLDIYTTISHPVATATNTGSLEAEPSSAAILLLQSRLSIKATSSQVSSLIKFTAENLIESLHNEIVASIVNADSVDSNPKTSNGKGENSDDKAGYISDADYSPEIGEVAIEEVTKNELFDIKGVSGDRVDSLDRLPSEEDISKLWSVRESSMTLEDLEREAEHAASTRGVESDDRDRTPFFIEPSRNEPTNKEEAVIVVEPPNEQNAEPSSRNEATNKGEKVQIKGSEGYSSSRTLKEWRFGHPTDLRATSRLYDDMLKYVQNWVGKYAGRGVGIYSEDRKDGVTLSFEYPAGSQLAIRVVSSTVVSADAEVAADGVFALTVCTEAGGPFLPLGTSEGTDGGKQTESESKSRQVKEEEREVFDGMVSRIEGALGRDLAGLMPMLSDDIDKIGAKEKMGKRVEGADADAYGETYSSVRDRNVPLSKKIEGVLSSESDLASKEDGMVGESILFRGRDKASSSTPTQREFSDSYSSDGSIQARDSRKKDPALVAKAEKAGVRLEKFEKAGLEEQAMRELNLLVESSKNSGLPAVIRSINNQTFQVTDVDEIGESSSNGSLSLPTLLSKGREISASAITEILSRPASSTERREFREGIAELTSEPAALPMALPEQYSQKDIRDGERIDIFQGPSFYRDGEDRLSGTDRSSSVDRLSRSLGIPSPSSPIAASSIAGKAAQEMALSTPPNLETFEEDKRKLRMLTRELKNSLEERHGVIMDSYRDVLLGDNFVFLMRIASLTCSDDSERALYAKMTDQAQILTAQLGTMVQTESMRYLQIIADICEVSMAFQHDEEEFLQRIDHLKPRFDTGLLSYLRYAVQEEELSMTIKGKDPSKSPSTWLQVLRVVQRGVLAEFEARFDRLLEPLLLIPRFNDRTLRSDLLRRFVNITAPLDLPYMRQLALNMANGVLQDSMEDNSALPSEIGDFPSSPDSRQSLNEKMRDLLSDVEIYLSSDVIEERLRTVTDAAREQGRGEIVWMHRNPEVQRELDAARKDEEEIRREERANESGVSILDRKAR